ncbi:protein-disulfide reductase DsbD family protein [Asaia bogorensis]|uniref:Cytochrome c-type biogenesis protein DsbD,protein-disulfide reductase n=2 Tax=Asaia TaxID=91914 RepID=A0A060QGJ5_9PROT|nr:thioredoxin family protein [Asaia bogorensis]CDG39793.1 Cytochrome c-type biogenesis protein DsbD,protein-disulfide reductase [Asaia bogorensis]
MSGPLPFPSRQPSQKAHPTRARAGRRWQGALGKGLAGLLACAGLPPLAAAWGAESAPAISAHSTASLISASDTASPGSSLHVALRLRLKPGWHTYWLNPGDAGDPATLRITATGALRGEAQTIVWPTPQRIRDASLMSYAYTGDVVLPVVLPMVRPVEPSAGRPPAAQPGQTPDGLGAQGLTTLSAHANWLVCAQSCIPEEGTFTLTLPVGAPRPSAQVGLFTQAEQHTPVPSPYPVSISPTGVLGAQGRELNRQSVAQAWFMPQERGRIGEAAPQALLFGPEGLALRLDPTADFTPAKPLSGILVLKAPDGTERALSVRATPLPPPMASEPSIAPSARPATEPNTGTTSGTAAEAAAGTATGGTTAGTATGTAMGATSPDPAGDYPAGEQPMAGHLAALGNGVPGPPHGGGESASGLFRLVVLGFLGGLVLNLMPCVFPILAMKALAVARMGQSERLHQKQSAISYAAGVILGFTALGALVMALRLGGAATGWGFQFQSTMFVGTITWLIFAMALNLLGVFVFLPPAFALSSSPRHGLVHDLLTGLLAVAVASPCTAPFMGVAIAGALAGPPATGLVIFAALGIGLAAPYVLLAFCPALAKSLPRPGAWMDYLRQFLAFPLLGTCVWLLWVAAVEGGATTVLLVSSGMVFLAFAAWVYGITQRRQLHAGHDRDCTALYGVALLGLLAAMALLPALLEQAPQAGANPPSASGPGLSALPSGTEAFSEERLRALHNAGKPVFVDMTAAWCITCLVNERMALNTQATQAAMARYGVITLRGDWTQRNPAITAFLRKHGRDGVPFYLFVPAHGAAVVLPQILTPGLVIGTITPHDK